MVQRRLNKINEFIRSKILNKSMLANNVWIVYVSGSTKAICYTNNKVRNESDIVSNTNY